MVGQESSSSSHRVSALANMRIAVFGVRNQGQVLHNKRIAKNIEPDGSRWISLQAKRYHLGAKRLSEPFLLAKTGIDIRFN
jgi:hypothetical protein